MWVNIAIYAVIIGLIALFRFTRPEALQVIGTYFNWGMTILFAVFIWKLFRNARS